MARSWRGRVQAGQGVAATFIRLDPVWRRLAALLGEPPYPGTLNLVSEDAEGLQTWLAHWPAESWEHLGTSICDADAWPVRVGGLLGVAIRPRLADYPAGLLEVAAAQHLRTWLHLAEGDWVEIWPEVRRVRT